MATERRERIHELTDLGIESAKDYLQALREDKRIPLPDSLLTAPDYATPIEPEVYVEKRTFCNRRQAAEYLAPRLGCIGTERVLGNHRLWSWLGMFYFDTVVRKDADGKPLVGSNDVQFVIDPTAQGRGERRRFAHRLMLAYEIYFHHCENAWYMLDEPVNSLTHFTDRFVGKPETFRSEGIIQLAHLLYADPNERKLKADIAGGGGNQRPAGGVVRLIDVLDQLYMNYDVYGMSPEQILPLLPPEFDRFKPTTQG